jgi:uncharacterized membrane protein
MALFDRIPQFAVIPALAVLIVLIDIPWLWSSSSWSGQMVRDIQGSPLQMKFGPAAIVYLALGYLATIPKSLPEAFGIGAATYAVYDFTNLAILKSYDPMFAIADTLWGGILMTIVHWIKTRV